ncbi:hypothetical protein DL96DRAFT_1627596, partial [Flagelloscypha sp. PMI_526]
MISANDLGSSSVSTTLPAELLIAIFEILIDTQPRSSILSIILLSRSIHQCFLPRLYHTVDFSGVSSKSLGEEVDRNEFLSSSNSSSWGFVHRLKCNIYHADFPLSSFYNVTFLALWGSQNLNGQPSVASGLVQLPLQELIVWYYKDISALAREITSSSTVVKTLEKLTTYSSSAAEPTAEWFQCANLTHILVICNNVDNIFSSALSKLYTNPRLRCYAIRASIRMIEAGQSRSHVPSDRRVVIPRRDISDSTLSGEKFWNEIATIWSQI